MGIIKAAKLFYDYVSKDEHDEIDEVIHAVSGVDLDVEAGQFIAILGHNGSGKSTLAKQINALLVPTGGTLLKKWIPVSRKMSGRCGRQPGWYSKIRIIRLSPVLSRRTWDSDRKTSVFLQRIYGNGLIRA